MGIRGVVVGASAVCTMDYTRALVTVLCGSDHRAWRSTSGRVLELRLYGTGQHMHSEPCMRRRLIDPSDTGLVIALSLQQSVAGWSHTGCVERARRVRTCVSRYACRRRFIKLGIVDKTPAGGRL